MSMYEVKDWCTVHDSPRYQSYCDGWWDICDEAYATEDSKGCEFVSRPPESDDDPGRIGTKSTTERQADVPGDDPAYD